jgi:hypothetical protein
MDFEGNLRRIEASIGKHMPLHTILIGVLTVRP